ncbi:MAG: hypothetical protein K8I02_06755, partial [Candidatus Methylomirabilis sp.]|nr:hypothetical protein [Deltaproteobacteria bacterium]
HGASLLPRTPRAHQERSRAVQKSSRSARVRSRRIVGRQPVAFSNLEKSPTIRLERTLADLLDFWTARERS